jgi:hypothetical protein
VMELQAASFHTISNDGGLYCPREVK